MPGNELFEFDGYSLDPEEHLLLRDGVPVPLEPKVFETLVVLIRHGGRLASKEKLLQEVWPDTFVEESNLVRHISILRKALSRDDGRPYIETVPKLGYRFVGEVRTLAGGMAEVIVQSTKVSVVVEEEESSVETEARPRSAPHETGEVTTGRGLHAATNEEPFVRSKRRHLTVGITVLLVTTAVATAFFFRANTVGEEVVDSVAVLPFINVGGGPDAEYLSDGVTESLLYRLSRLPNLKVMSRNSVFRYKGLETDAQAVGRELGVRAVLTGKVIQRGDDLIVSAELVDVRDNSQLWGGQYDRKMSDLLAVQTDMARDISRQLRPKLSSEAQQRLAVRDTESPEAYELYLKGRYALNTLTFQRQNGLGYFEQAVEKDPRFALAYAGMAEAYVLMASIGSTFRFPPREAYSRAKAAALRAVEIDDTLAEAHVSLGLIAFNSEWDWAGAEREFKRALELNPDLITARHWYSHLLIAQGRFDESLAESLRGLSLDPLDVAMNFHLGFHFWNTRQLDQGSAQLQKTLALNPNHHETHNILGLVYAQQGNYRDAIAELQRATELGSWDNRGHLGYVYAVSGQRNEAQKLVAELVKETRTKDVSPCNIARIYAGLGQNEQAFVWLERAIAERDTNLTMPGLKVDAQLDSLHSDPRFQDLLRQMGLTR